MRVVVRRRVHVDEKHCIAARMDHSTLLDLALAGDEVTLLDRVIDGCRTLTEHANLTSAVKAGSNAAKAAATSPPAPTSSASPTASAAATPSARSRHHRTVRIKCLR